MKTNHWWRRWVEGSVRTNFCLLAVLILILSANLPLRATTVQRLTLDDMVSKAETIVIGRVINSQSAWTKDGKLILTQTTLEVQEGLKGTTRKTVTVTTLGGRVGNAVLHVSGMPTFQLDETAVIFLERSSSYLTVLGLSQGKFSIVNGEVSNHLNGLSFEGGAPGVPTRMRLTDFKRQIQQRLLNK
jgi:hypothetical protein